MKQLLIISLLLLAGCSGEVRPMHENVYEIRDIGELSTSEYTIGKMVKVDDADSSWYWIGKYGDRKILINTKAKVKAGVDLSKIKEDDITVKGNSITIKLPPAEITSFSMDPKYTYTEMESVNGFRDKFTQKEKNTFMRQGEDAIRDELKNVGILQDAEKNAEEFIKDFYKQLGYKRVIIKKTTIL